MGIRIEELVKIANAHELLMDGTTGPVVEIIDSADLIFGIFDDPDAGIGVGSYVIKGLPMLESIAAGDHARPITVTAVKVLDRAMAVAAAKVLGDGRESGDMSFQKVGD